MLILADNGNTGYRVAGILLQEPIQLDDGMPTFVRQAFDSFVPLAANSSGVQQPTTVAQQSQQNNATDLTNPLSSNIATGSNSNTTAAQTTQQLEPVRPASPFSQQLQSQQQ